MNEPERVRKRISCQTIWPSTRKNEAVDVKKRCDALKRISYKYSERSLTSLKQIARIGVDDKPYRRCALLFIENYINLIDKPTYTIFRLTITSVISEEYLYFYLNKLDYCIY